MSEKKQVMADPDSLQATWGLYFQNDVLFGLVTRNDDVTVTDKENAWENDCVELFLDVDGTFTQLRSVVGEGWGPDGSLGLDMECAWAADGSVFEFAVQIPGGNLKDRIIGFNINITDNDGDGEQQYYPTYGHNVCYEGKELAQLIFINNYGETAQIEIPNSTLPPFDCNPSAAPVLDCVDDAGEWDAAVECSYGFDQMNIMDQRFASKESLQASWTLMYSGDTLYGRIKRQDDILETSLDNPWENDCIELFIDIDGSFSQLRTVVGQDWGESYNPLTEAGMLMSAVWNADGTVCEFSVQLGEELAGKIIAFNINITDNDGAEAASEEAGSESQYYPTYGHNLGWQGFELAGLLFTE